MATGTITTDFALLETFGKLLSYPGETYLAEVEGVRSLVSEIDVEAGRCLEDFGAALTGRSVEEAQELYVQTFDLNPICALEVGWQLYGDNYDRGNFLVKMRQEFERWGAPETAELPDHLSNVLPLLARMERNEACRLSTASVVPAVKRMLAGFEGKNNPYAHVLNALCRILEAASGEPALEANHE